MKVPFFRRVYNKTVIEEIEKVLRSGFLTSGSVGLEVEKRLSKIFNTSGATLFSSWTTAWQSILDFHNIGPGDEVIMPSLTFVSCANMVLKRGAKVVFCDVSADSLIVNQDVILPYISRKTKLILNL